MMKVLSTFILFSLFTVSQANSKYDLLLGGEFGQSKGHWNDYNGDWEEHMGMRLGVESEFTRIFASYNYSKSDNFSRTNGEYESHVAALFLEAKTKEYYHFIKAFVGGHFGAIYSQWNIGGITANEKEDETDALLGAQTGIIIDLTDKIYLEAGYRISLTSANNSSVNPGHFQQYYGAFNIKF